MHEGSATPMAFTLKPSQPWYEEIIPGLWFWTEVSSKSGMRHADHMLRVFGHDPDEVRKWETTTEPRKR